MHDSKISEAVINRLPKYYRYLSELEAKGTQTSVIFENEL